MIFLRKTIDKIKTNIYNSFENQMMRFETKGCMDVNKVCKFIRILTLAPLLAAISLILIFVFCPDVFPTGLDFAFMLFYLGILPLLAYPLQPMIPRFRNKGRDGQRTLAMLFAVAGYLLCFVNCIFADATKEMWLITLEYLISGVLILVFNKVFHIKISAHGCGSAGPIFLLLYFGLYIPSVLMAIATAVTYWASVKMKRHTVAELIGGSLVSVLLLGVLAVIFHYI